jgi:MtN3 and saliva related transmembrane protein
MSASVARPARRLLHDIGLLPQVIKTWRTRSTKDISLGIFLVLVAGIVLRLAYGTIRADVPRMVANAVTLVLAGIILVFKLKYG